MMGFNLKSISPIRIYKGLNLIMGVITLGIGLFSYFQSTWVKNTLVFRNRKYLGEFVTYRICANNLIKPSNLLKACPHIAWERFFVSIIIICFVLSLISFLLEIIERVNLRKRPYKIADSVYHLIAAIALIIAGILYILSALLIYDVLDLENAPEEMPEHKFRTVEKLVSAVFVFLQAICYGATAYQLRK